ncbi:LPS export ABC transporter periplasmic protein LptC [Nitrogeniibacter mangrovi]|uniref:LPS export ABC transporter periplasmic protein LptC n=1 Tax=Nitrogeniibacter mangrovi TaxID=2016596 RepID=A0A6C1B534_9RHOO|nr:LPS export ABC transporter periplasmic protein LptC [Nitrogeniibacter mangrovi]QID18801.1 LPS export ABC transporter periplasmic protein LptC [Nitrogeniibacter mangrovi]
MRLTLQHAFPVIALTVLAAGSFWLERATRGPGTAVEASEEQGPDIIVEQMALTRFDINGKPHYYLDAREMRHLPGQAHSRLTDPVVHLVRDALDMRLASRSADVRDDGDRVDMAGNVRGERTIPGEPTTHFASESLIVWPNVESAKSLDPVTITQDGATARGDTMTADNVFGVMTLTGHVQAHMPIKRK